MHEHRAAALPTPFFSLVNNLRNGSCQLPASRGAVAAQPASFTRYAAWQAPGVVQAHFGSIMRRWRRAHAQPCRTCTPANLHGAEGALEERVSGALAVLKRAGALCLQCANRPVACSKRAAAGRGGRAVARGRWLAWEEVVAQARRRSAGRGGVQSEAAARARRRQGRGWVRSLSGQGDRAENEEVE